MPPVLILLPLAYLITNGLHDHDRVEDNFGANEEWNLDWDGILRLYLFSRLSDHTINMPAFERCLPLGKYKVYTIHKFPNG